MANMDINKWLESEMYSYAGDPDYSPRKYEYGAGGPGILTQQQKIDMIKAGNPGHQSTAWTDGSALAALNRGSFDYNDRGASNSFFHDILTEWLPPAAIIGGPFLAGVAGLYGAGAGAAGAGAEGAAGAFNPLADWGAEYFSGAGQYTGGAAGAAGGSTGGGGMDWFNDFLESIGVNQSSQSFPGGGADTTNYGPGAGGNLMPPADPSGMNPNMLETGTQNWDPTHTGGGGILDTLRTLGMSPSQALQLATKLGAAGLGALGSSQQAGALRGLADQYSASGAPSRARYEASMQSGFDPLNIPGYAGAVDNASKSLLARLSATGGNPFGNPAGLIEANKAIVSGTAMPAINEYQRMNLAGGGLANLNAAVPSLQTQAIGADSNVWNSLGYGLQQATAPQQTSLTDLMKAFGMTGLA